MTDVTEFLIPYQLVLLNLPLFAIYLLVLAGGIERLAASRNEQLAAMPAPPI